MSFARIKSNAKINLALNVVGKSKSLQRIESLVSFIALHDDIKISETKKRKDIIIFKGKF